MTLGQKCKKHPVEVPMFPLRLFGITVAYYCILCNETYVTQNVEASLAPFRQIVKRSMIRTIENKSSKGFDIYSKLK